VWDEADLLPSPAPGRLGRWSPARHPPWWWRALLVAWLGLGTAGLLLTTLTGESTPSLVLVIGIGLLAMMAWAGIFELLSRARPQPPTTTLANPITVLRGWLARARRTVELATIIARFGLARFGRPQAAAPQGSATGRAIRMALERAGGVFIKLGQFLSTRPDLVSPEIAEELRLLQQQAEPVAGRVMAGVFEEEFGVQPAQRFAAFDEQPVAAASLAQVHHAVLADDTPVAVKIQRPEVGQRVRTDLEILRRLAARLERRTPWARELRLSQVADAFADNVAGELDFRAEARNLNAVADAIGRHPRFFVPQPTPGLTRSRVLVMDWVQGTRLTDATATLGPEAREELGRGLLRCFLDQLLVVGTFHADPHPGNLFLAEDGRVALLDCGSIGRLDRRQTRALQEIVLAIDTQDAAQLRDALRQITTATRAIDGVLLERALGDVLAQHLAAGATLGSALFVALMDVMRGFGLALEPVAGGALRALATLQATFELVAPSLDLMEEAKSYGRSLLRGQWVSVTQRSARDELQAALVRAMPMLIALPRRLDRIMEAVEGNDLAVGVHLLADDQDRRSVEQLTAPLVAAVAGASTGLIGGLLLLAANPLLATTTGRLLQALGIGCATVALLALLRILVVALRHLRER
jgi:ubiquinone biosynthesis protein